MSPEPLKHGLAGPAVRRLAGSLEKAWPDFDATGFVRAATRGLGKLELKERVDHVARMLARFLPEAYPEALEVVVAAARAWDGGDENDPLRGFAAWPLFHFIEIRGVDHFAESMAALRSLTHLFSGEFAVRPLIARYPKRAFRMLERWTGDGSEHVRRLASEGCRPRLPWATRVPALIEDPTPVLAVLERLKDDPSEYVRRSVANNLNDIAKDHPDLVIDLCEGWLEGASDERRWIVERATRTLVKAGHPRVWGLLGFTRRPRIEVSDITLDAAAVQLGGRMRFTVELTSTGRSPQRLAVDYVVHFVKANGKTRPKVFKGRVVKLAPGEVVSITRHISFQPMSTRVYYPGAHAVELLVNGTPSARAGFDVRAGE